MTNILMSGFVDATPAVHLLGCGPRAVRNIYGIGRNYAAHARELGNSIPDEPVVFLKPNSCLIGDGGQIELPPQSTDTQYEVEIVLLLGCGGHAIRPDDALRCVAGYGVGIDVTARDLQNKARLDGNPWAVAKGFATFAPVSQFVPAEAIKDTRSLSFDLFVNGEQRQVGHSHDMVFDFAALICHLSTIFLLCPGDLVFTGTPEGVARIAPGDVLRARLIGYDAEVTVSSASMALG